MVGETTTMKEVFTKLNNYEEVKGKLHLRLVREDGGAVSRSAAEYGFEDLVLVPTVENILDDEDGQITSCKVNESLAKSWGMTVGEVFDQAMENTKADYEIMPMMDILSVLMGINPEEMEAMEQVPMLVITNKAKMHGASAIIPAASELRKRFPEGYMVIPSSVHEVIVVKRDDVDAAEMANIIQEVNKD